MDFTNINLINLNKTNLEAINGGGFWEDVGEWPGEHTARGTWNKLADAYCRYEWNISYKEYCKLVGAKWD